MRTPRLGAVQADFVAGPLGRRRVGGGLARQMLARAVGFKGKALSVFDATAGLGRDAFLLACLGCRVTAVERSPIVAALFEDGLARAAREPSLFAMLNARLRLILGDSREILAGLGEAERPDVVYLDPMFAARKKTALSKKEMQLCRLVAGDDLDAAELYRAAWAAARGRVVVKRWLRAPTLAGPPTFACKGTTVRYDVYVRL